MNEVSNQMAEGHTKLAADVEALKAAAAKLEADAGEFVQTAEDVGDESKPLPN